ncbi:MAG TPA: hypothetical protein VH092_04735 [Urbifossiella sp.]|jgi:hypothetical protein|nr:hypothetical protein [Urbifossiella sp.]
MRSLILATALGLTAALAAAQDAPAPLLTATGTVEKADKAGLTVKPRGADGKFQKSLTLKVTGTSKVAVLTPQNRDGKVVLTQREAAAQDLAPGQAVAVIYAEAGKDGGVLLAAVAQPAGK